jgi:hypothetical protein
MISLQDLRIRTRRLGGAVLAATLASLLAAPEAILMAQEPATTSTAVQAAPAAGAPEQSAKLSSDELDSLVAPIALYPDSLLAQVLVASTYPIDVIAAQQWLAKNSNLKGDELSKAAMQQDWDPSVQALVSLPDALKVLSDNVKWTEDLGDAFLAQQNDVMEAVQRMRKKAKDNGKLESSEQQKVETKVIETKETIIIQPSNPEVVYVPSYNPTVVYPPPVYPYPPMYYPPYYPGAALMSFGVGVAIGVGISGGWGCGWGGGGNNTININNNNNYVKNNNVRNNQGNRTGNSNWSHNAQQRGGAPYKDKATASKYGGSARGDSAASRQAGAQSRQASSQSRGGGDRSGGAGNRGGASASTRSSGSGNFGSSGGGNRAGSRDVGGGGRSGSSSAFGGSSRSGGGGYSGSSARSSSSRGSASRSGGGSRGGGGGGRRR